MIGRNFPSYKMGSGSKSHCQSPFSFKFKKMSSIFLEELHLFIAKNVIIYIYSLHFLSVF